ncbi:hypothetical protein ABEY13_16650 [Bacillus velezensis]|uniref:hypothetical protein n=1 Tax=Bacillus velezensis TaxID=492670 RepID=UPI002DBDC49F|nr:hypothetical protein [Bacillus velezensis]MEC3660392.1 hypothetical protein [Bacillus velezensis]MEC3687969.1 hypothetical protein [Bacillus velezensis]MEC3791220.1 hypothetical protein [Bacillus velezensis]
MAKGNSNWISFLRQYGPIPRNDNMYDETIQRIIKKKKVTPIKIEMIYLNQLLQNFFSESPVSVILTGTAGDGKTYYCRELWKKLGGSEEQWAKNNRRNELLLNGKRIIFIKDLSELSSDEKEELILMADSIVGLENKIVFLIAANDGQLLDSWKSIRQTDNVIIARKLIEDLLISGKRQKEDQNLWLYNLSHTNSAHLFPKVVNEVLHNPGWEECRNCSFSTGEKICPIIENKKRLESENSLIVKRLTDLLTLCEVNELHLPLRQLLLLIANMFLGHPDVKDSLLKCSDIPKVIEKDKVHLASIYRNIFGENLQDRKRDTIDVFNMLNKFGIGSETNGMIDNILIYGEDDKKYKELYEKLVITDTIYGADKKFISEKKAYLEGENLDKNKFLDLLKSQRQRLFFVIPPEIEEVLMIWRLTTFQFAGEFLKEVYRPLHEEKRVNSQYISRMAKGLNRITTGLLVEDKDRLILSTSGNHSQAKISRILEEFISVKPNRGEYVKFELDKENSKVYLDVGFSNDLPPVRIHLQLVRYEFISRVAEGALPGSFSRECYEDILAYKSKLLKRLAERRKTEDDADENILALKLLKINEKGLVEHKSLEVF